MRQLLKALRAMLDLYGYDEKTDLLDRLLRASDAELWKVVSGRRVLGRIWGNVGTGAMRARRIRALTWIGGP